MHIWYPFRLMVRVVITAFTVLAITHFIEGISVSSFVVALAVSLILGILHLLVRPILMLLTLPITLITFGLFTLVINGFLLYLVQFIVVGFSVKTLLAGFLGALIISVVSTITQKIIA